MFFKSFSSSFILFKLQHLIASAGSKFASRSYSEFQTHHCLLYICLNFCQLSQLNILKIELLLFILISTDPFPWFIRLVNTTLVILIQKQELWVIVSKCLGAFCLLFQKFLFTGIQWTEMRKRYFSVVWLNVSSI